MKIAMPYQDGVLLEHFGRAKEFIIYNVSDLDPVTSEVIAPEDLSHAAVARVLKEHGVDVVLCGSIGEHARQAVEGEHMLVFSGITGAADDVLERFLQGNLETVDGDFAAAHNPSQAEETIRMQISKTGDTIYAVSGVEIRCDEPRFVPVAVLNALRRTCIEKLDGNRSAAYPGPVRRPENRQAVFPQTALTGADNVTNPLAERFYREHGVETVEAGYDLNDRFDGVRVMRMRYCLRREIGQCLCERPDYRGRLFIETGRNRYELMFDCKRCEMSVVCRNRTE